MRNWHYLRPSRATGWPSQSVALSVVCSAGSVASSSQVRRSAKLLGWAASLWSGDRGTIERVSNADGIDQDSFWRWLTRQIKRGQSTWIWQMYACHGMAALGLWDMLTRREWVLNGTPKVQGEGEDNAAVGSRLCPLIISDPPTIVHTRTCGGGGSVCWLDIRNLGVSDCRAIGGLCGGSGHGDDSLPEGFRTGREIARSRAATLRTWLDGWYAAVRELNLGGLRATAAAQSWHGWRTNYLPCVVEVHNDAERLSAERRSIFGGRNECYKVRAAQSDVSEIDASAHYPARGSAGSLPGRIARCEGLCRYSPSDLSRAGYCIIADGECWVRKPVLPYRKDGRTVYPVGHWRGTYCWPEWELLLREGGEANFKRWWVYEPCDPFSGFFRRLWGYRSIAKSNGEHAKASAVKLLMNGLIGKLCSQAKYWQDCPDLFYPEPWYAWQQVEEDGNTVGRYRSVAWRVQREVIAGEGDETVPALASWIYSLGRVRLWEWMSIANQEDIYYVDTDSLWTNRRGFDRLCAAVQMDSGQLGGLRHVETHAWARFYGQKHYETPSGVTCAGVPRTGLLRTEQGWTYWAADTPAQAARRGESVTAELIRHTVSDRISYQGGKIGGDGTVYPFEVNDDGQEETRRFKRHGDGEW